MALGNYLSQSIGFYLRDHVLQNWIRAGKATQLFVPADLLLLLDPPIAASIHSYQSILVSTFDFKIRLRD